MGQIDEVTSVTRDVRLRGSILVKAIEEEKSGAQLNLGLKRKPPTRPIRASWPGMPKCLILWWARQGSNL